MPQVVRRAHRCRTADHEGVGLLVESNVDRVEMVERASKLLLRTNEFCSCCDRQAQSVARSGAEYLRTAAVVRPSWMAAASNAKTIAPGASRGLVLRCGDAARMPSAPCTTAWGRRRHPPRPPSGVRQSSLHRFGTATARAPVGWRCHAAVRHRFSMSGGQVALPVLERIHGPSSSLRPIRRVSKRSLERNLRVIPWTSAPSRYNDMCTSHSMQSTVGRRVT
jgi:hypothetical protein